MLSLGGVDTRFITTDTALSIHTARTATGTGVADGDGQKIFINLGNVDNGNQNDFTVSTTSNELFTSDGFLKSIMFVSMAVLPISFSEWRMPGLKTVPNKLGWELLMNY